MFETLGINDRTMFNLFSYPGFKRVLREKVLLSVSVCLAHDTV